MHPIPIMHPQQVSEKLVSIKFSCGEIYYFVVFSDCYTTLNSVPSCKGTLPAYYWDVSTKSCRLTAYGAGCNGIVNVFKTLDECDYVARKVCIPAITKVVVPTTVKQILVTPASDVFIPSYGTPVSYGSPYAAIVTSAFPY